MAKLTIVCVLLCLISVDMCAPMSCPNEEGIYPCSCKPLAYGLNVVCANFNSSISLTKAFKILRDCRIHTLLFHALYLKDMLPVNLFDGMQIKEIRIQKSKLEFPQPAFSGLDSSLSILNVEQQSMIKSHDRFSLARLTKLNELYVQSNQMETVEDKWLNEKVPNVHTVVLDCNQITELESHAFANLEHLKTISLANNQIETIQRSMFPRPAPQLMRIDLSKNKVSHLPYDFFSEMPSLIEMVFSSNKLTTLPEATWLPVWEQLKQLLLVKNELRCTEELEWMRPYPKPSQFDGDCALPKERAGKSLNDVYSNR